MAPEEVRKCLSCHRQFHGPTRNDQYIRHPCKPLPDWDTDGAADLIISNIANKTSLKSLEYRALLIIQKGQLSKRKVPRIKVRQTNFTVAVSGITTTAITFENPFNGAICTVDEPGLPVTDKQRKITVFGDHCDSGWPRGVNKCGQKCGVCHPLPDIKCSCADAYCLKAEHGEDCPNSIEGRAKTKEMFLLVEKTRYHSRFHRPDDYERHGFATQEAHEDAFRRQFYHGRQQYWLQNPPQSELSKMLKREQEDEFRLAILVHGRIKFTM